MWLYRFNHVLGPVLGLYWRLGLQGRIESIPTRGPLIVAANHASYLDPWLIGMVFPRPVRYLITRQWYDRSNAWRAFFRAFGVEPIRMTSGAATVEAVCVLLDRGDVVGVFPEGRISQDGRVGRFRSGLAHIAARSGAPVLPVGIRGGYESLPRHARVPRPRRVTVHVGDVRRFDGAPIEGPPSPLAGREFLAKIRAEVCRLAGQPVAAW